MPLLVFTNSEPSGDTVWVVVPRTPVAEAVSELSVVRSLGLFPQGALDQVSDVLHPSQDDLPTC